MLPPVDEGSTAACVSGSSRVLTWNGSTSVTCAQGVTASKGNVIATGTITVGQAATTACTSANVGAIRFNASTSLFEGCSNGASWQPLGGNVPSGTLCGSVFWQTDGGFGSCNNIQNDAPCMGEALMKTCGVVDCPTGYKPVSIAYSWGPNPTVADGIYRYQQYSCAKE